MDAVSVVLWDAALLSWGVPIALMAGLVLAGRDIRRRMREVDLKHAKREIKEIFVSENLGPQRNPVRLWSGLLPIEAAKPRVFTDTGKRFLNVITSPEYPKAYIVFVSDQRVLQGTRLKVEVARDRLSDELLQIVPVAA